MTSTAASLNPTEMVVPLKPRPLNSLLAAATRITSHSVGGPARRHGASDGWQADAWDTYDQVGEQRFLASTLANRMSQARLFVGRLPENPTDAPEPLEDGTPFEVFQALQKTPAALGQMVRRWGVLLFIAGEGYLAGIPREVPTIPDASTPDWISPIGQDEESSMSLSDLDWLALSEDEVSVSDDDKVTVTVAGEARELDGDTCWLVRIWRPHPRRAIEPESPTRSSLPVLRELIGLTMHVSAQVDSRLAGAGVFLVPQEAAKEIKRRNGVDDEEDITEDLTAMLMEAMLTPIGDRSNASAIVPLVLEVPGESIEQFRHLTFSTPLDGESRALREEAIRRLALGQDCPPELLLGVGAMNHWGAWLVREDVVTTHIEPPLALICDAMTSQYLWPILEQQGMAPEEAQQYIIWYSVEHLIVRPNRGQDALNLYDRGELSGPALRDTTGFSETDAPEIEEDVDALDPAVALALDMVRAAPSLAQAPGLPQLVQSIRAVLAGNEATDAAVERDRAPEITEEIIDVEEEGEEPTTSEIPDTQDDPADTQGDDSLAAGGRPSSIKVTGFLGEAIKREQSTSDDDDSTDPTD